MSSKARFPGPSSAANPKASKSASSTNVSGSKRINTLAAVVAGTTAQTRAGPPQVFLNGKIVTPQSLIQRKGGSPHRSKHARPPLVKPQTIDEGASENADRSTAGFSSKMHLKSRADMSESTRGASKYSLGNKTKVAVEETFSICLTETATVIHLGLSSFQMASDTRDIVYTDERNARYEASVKAHQNVDGFTSRPAQTKNNQLKNQNEMAAPNAVKDSGAQAISYEIKDEIAQLTMAHTETDVATSLGVGTDNKTDDLNGLNASVKKFVLDTVAVALVTPGCQLDTTHAIKPPAPGEHTQSKGKTDRRGKNIAMTGGGNRLGSQQSIGGNNTSDAPSDDMNPTSGFFGPPGTAGTGNNNKTVAGHAVNPSSASSGNNSGDNLPAPSGSRANVSQSNADSNIDSEDGGRNGGYEQFTEEDSQQLVQDIEIKRILSLPMLLKRLQMTERAIQQNANYRSQLDYRDLPDIAPLYLLDKAKQADGIEGTGLMGKSTMGIKKFADRNRSLSIANVNNNASEAGSQYLSDNASVHSADDASTDGTRNKNATRGGIDPAMLLGDGNKVKKLFAYANKELIQGRAVTAMAWNAVSSDLLAVGYGRLKDIIKPGQPASTASHDQATAGTGKGHGIAEKGFHGLNVKDLHAKDKANAKDAHGKGTGKDSKATNGTATANDTNPNQTSDNPANPSEHITSEGIQTDEALQGLVLFWSLRNPDYPEKILRTSHSVTALDFSRQHPMILAVGLSNGDVNVYDVKREGASWGIPVESSAGMPDSHLDPVWQLKWIVRGAERLETLVSISTDGRVLEWNLKKGLVMSKLMDLKKSGTGEGWISNSSAGLSFDFHPEDPTTYITGTEDGNLHRCSVSYNEQYLETYTPHAGPVYRVKFSTRWPNVFLTASADWSMNLYHVAQKQPLLQMRATAENFPINDICWCLDNSTVFATVTVDAKLQIWDLSVSSIDPVVTVDVGAEDMIKEKNGSAGKDGGIGEDGEIDPALLEDGGSITGNNANHPSSPPLNASRFSDRYGRNEEEHSTPMQKLIKSLSVEPKKRILTRVLFGEKNPIVAVGDSHGNVTVYRVFDPLTITHLGPLQQFQKLKAAVLRQTDPAMAATLQNEVSKQVEIK